MEILDVNPNYAYVRLNNGRETTVSLRHIAPLGDENNYSLPELAATEDPIKSSLDHPPPPSITKDSAINTLADIENYAPETGTPTSPRRSHLDDLQRTSLEDADALNPRRSSRVRRKPPYLAENYQL